MAHAGNDHGDSSPARIRPLPVSIPDTGVPFVSHTTIERPYWVTVSIRAGLARADRGSDRNNAGGLHRFDGSVVREPDRATDIETVPDRRPGSGLHDGDNDSGERVSSLSSDLHRGGVHADSVLPDAARDSG